MSRPDSVSSLRLPPSLGITPEHTNDFAEGYREAIHVLRDRGQLEGDTTVDSSEFSMRRAARALMPELQEGVLPSQAAATQQAVGKMLSELIDRDLDFMRAVHSRIDRGEGNILPRFLSVSIGALAAYHITIPPK